MTRDWRFCFEAIGPAAADTGGLTYLRHFLAHVDDDARRRMTVLLSRPVPEQLELDGVAVRTLPEYTATGTGKTVAIQALLPFVFRRLGVDVVFCSGTFVGALAAIPGGPRVVLHVFNAGPLQKEVRLAPGARDTYRRIALPAGLRAADHLVVPTQVVKDALVERYRLDEGRVTVVPLAAAPQFRPLRAGESDEPPMSKPYILFVSALWAYKKADSLIRAFARLVDRDGIPHRLVLVGKGADESRLRAIAAEEGVAERTTFTGHTAGSQLESLYRHADLFVFPSLIESWGFPLVEAMASGVPVVASDRWSVPEVCGGAAHICEPTTDALETAMRDVLGSPQLRAELVRRGLARSAEFSWGRTVRETMRVLQDVALDRA